MRSRLMLSAAVVLIFLAPLLTGCTVIYQDSPSTQVIVHHRPPPPPCPVPYPRPHPRPPEPEPPRESREIRTKTPRSEPVRVAEKDPQPGRGRKPVRRR